MVRLQGCAEAVLLVVVAAVGAGADLDSGRDVAVDVEVRMGPPTAMRAANRYASRRSCRS